MTSVSSVSASWGAPWRLQAAGHTLFLHDIGPLPSSLLEAGAVGCASGKEVASKAAIVILMVPDTPNVDAALFAADGVAEGLSAGKIVIDMSSISPISTKEFAAKINALGCDYLDAPVSGGEEGAKEASLTIIVGGPEAAFEKVRPLFEKMGKNVTLVGGTGDGQTTKVANQIIVALTIEAVGEALFEGHLAPGTCLLLADGAPPMPPGVQGFGGSLLHAIMGMLELGHGSAVVLNSDSPTLPTACLCAPQRR